MDYVLFGMGYGASLMLLGWALRTFGPQLKYARPPQHEDPNFLVERRFWLRFVQGLGGVIAIAGTTMVLMTFVVVLTNPTDDTGTTISFAIWAFTLAVLLIWCWLYLSRYGLTGIWSRDRGYGFRSAREGSPGRVGALPQASSVNDVSSGNAVAITIDERAVESEPQLGQVDDAEHSGSAPTEGIGLEPPEESPLINAPDSDSFAAADSAEPVYDFGDSSDTTVPKDLGGRAEALRRLRQRQARAGQSSS